MRKFDKVSARVNFSPRYHSAVAKKAMKPLVFMYHEARNIFLCFSKLLVLCLAPLRYIPVEVRPPPSGSKWSPLRYSILDQWQKLCFSLQCFKLFMLSQMILRCFPDFVKIIKPFRNLQRLQLFSDSVSLFFGC